MCNQVLYWIVNEEGKSLAITPAPKGNAYLEASLQNLSQNGVEVICNLLSLKEINELGLDEMEKLCKAEGMTYMHIPISDFGYPMATKENISKLNRVYNEFGQGRKVMLHCKMGIGRSGTIATYMLLKSGYSLQEALDLVSEKRGMRVPESEAQINWLKEQYEKIKL